MDPEEAVAYIHSNQWRRSRPGLARIRTLLRALGDPQRGMKFVHVAGTDGKGSTCACIASVLQAAGYRVGLNTSPYLVRFNERIRVDGEMISDEELAALTGEIRPVADRAPEHPTEFELITALALLYFRRRNCDVVVLEVGMGGALDASNVIDPPEAAVITAMGMDHVKELGPTMADIAAAKAGIIKEGCAVVSYGGVPEADAVFRRVCAEKHAALTEADFSRLQLRSLSLTESRFNFLPYQDIRLPLAGTYQPRNAAVAITALEVLRQKGWRISDGDIVTGLGRVRWPGRFELLRRGPVFLLDGAHNPHGMTATSESLRALFPGRSVVFLVGVMADKDVSRMMALIAPMARAFFTVRPDNPRAMDAQTLRQLLLPYGKPVRACVSVGQAVEAAAVEAGPEGVVCALGSLYFSGDVRKAVAELSL
jgi:dihydrofolate synthase/folylpolyglutamate synthase